jgi:hypothetical protein
MKAVDAVACELLDEAEFPIEIGLHRCPRVVGALVGPLVVACSSGADGDCFEAARRMREQGGSLHDPHFLGAGGRGALEDRKSG